MQARTLFPLLCLALTLWASAAAEVDGPRIMAADEEPHNWLAHGRTYGEQRHSPLKEINRDTVKRLGLAWSFELPSRRGQEATPLVIDGVMYVTGAWSMVFALDAVTGEPLWQYDPAAPRAVSKFACCDAVNSGVAAWGDRVFVGTLDGRLIALERRTGEVAWSVNTVPENSRYTITGAPRVVKGKVLIGNGGGEVGVRGYVSAYDADTGAMHWRFYTVPGDPALGFEHPALAAAATTWTGEWWRLGGGGTVWDSMAYDPELDLLYIGVGNGSPWRRDLRSPDGGDNLFLSSIVALRPDTGDYVWHYQTTPGETWDYTATQHMILADVEWQGETRKVLLQAPKNGFFYVLDRVTGELLAADPFVPVNWASGVDMDSGRPIETGMNYATAQKRIRPSPIGGHNWQPMAFSPDTGLVYLPALDAPYNYGPSDRPDPRDNWRTGADFAAGATPIEISPALENALAKRLGSAHLLAWDPVRKTPAWRVQHPHPWNGGVLSTAGGLVFQGDATGTFSAYDARDGVRVWQQPANTGIVAAPMTYAVDGRQYVAILAGWGGSVALVGGRVNADVQGGATGRLLVYALDGEGEPPPGLLARQMPKPPRNTALDQDIRAGFATYARHCGMCHGPNVASGGVIPDLRYLSPETHAVFGAIVGDGILESAGMPGFGHRLSAAEIEQIRAYVIFEANREWYRRDDPAWWRRVKRFFADAGGWVLAQAL